MKQKIKNFLFPSVDDEVQEHIDRDSLNSLHILAAFVFFFELIAFIIFLVTRKQYDEDTLITIGSVLFCMITCVIVFFFTSKMRKENLVPHRSLAAFKIFFILILSAWAIWVSWRHYTRDDQLLTFLTVELMVVCFIPLRPWHSVILNCIIYGGLYLVLFSVDGASSLNSFNYFVLVLVTMVGMIVRFHAQKKLAEKTILLERKNAELEFANRHDVLTGLRNRLALNEDTGKVTGEQMSAYMIDIDYFKEFNDSFGHAAGDEVLKETARKLEMLFPGSFCYRYGGDEFVVLSTQGETFEEDLYCFTIPEVNDQKICLSIGSESAAPENYDQVFDLIDAADRKLYDVKKRTHSSENSKQD